MLIYINERGATTGIERIEKIEITDWIERIDNREDRDYRLGRDGRLDRIYIYKRRAKTG